MRAIVIAAALGTLMPLGAHAQPAGGPLTVTPDRPSLHPRAQPATVPLDPSGFVQILTPFAVVEAAGGPVLVRVPHYQGPDGSYDTPADLTNAINGVPCGQECTARSLRRWGYRP